MRGSVRFRSDREVAYHTRMQIVFCWAFRAHNTARQLFLMFVAHWDLSLFHIISAQALALKILWKPVAHHGASVASLVVVVVFVSALICGLSHRRSRTGAHMCQLYPTVRCAFSTLCELKDNGQLFKIAFAVLQLGGSRTGHVKARVCRCLRVGRVESANFCQDHLPLSIQITGICGLRSFLVNCSGFDQILLSWVCRTVFHWIVMGTKSLWFDIHSENPAQRRCCQYYLTVCKVRPMNLSKWLIHVEWLFWLMCEARIMSL